MRRGKKVAYQILPLFPANHRKQQKGHYLSIFIVQAESASMMRCRCIYILGAQEITAPWWFLWTRTWWWGRRCISGTPNPNNIDEIFFNPNDHLGEVSLECRLSLLQGACFQPFINSYQEWPWLQRDKAVLHILD